jgi:hypothetical protein
VTQILDDPVVLPTVPAGMIVLRADTVGDDQRVHASIVGGPEEGSERAFPVEGQAPDFSDWLPMTDAIRAIDVLEHVTDDERWIANLAKRLTPGGTLTIRLPLEGPMAWLDGLNIYRYLQDTTGIGKELEETRLKGWHRHYRVAEVVTMVKTAGLDVTSVVRSGSPHAEAARFVGLAWGALRHREGAMGRRMRNWSEHAAANTSGASLGRCSRWVTVEARKA